MLEFFREALVQIVTGALVGYGTNNLAVKMIFREYFGLGGVILKTRAEFSRNLGELVESDLITGQGLALEMEKPEFRQAFATFVTDLITHDLHQATGELRLGDLAGFDATVANSLLFIERHQERYLQHLLASAGERLTVGALLSPGQRLHAAAWAVRTSHDLLVSTGAIASFSQQLYAEWRTKSPAALITPAFTRQLGQGLPRLLSGTHQFLRTEHHAIIALAQSVYDALSVPHGLAAMEQRLMAKSPAELFGLANAGNLSSRLLAQVLNYLTSPAGRPILEKLALALLAATRRTDKTLFELLPAGIATGLEKFIRQETPGLVESLLALLRTSQTELDEIIDKTVEYTLRQHEAKFALSLKRFFNRKTAVAGQLIRNTERQVDVDSLATTLTEQLIGYLKQQTVGQIVGLLEEKKILHPDLLVTLLAESLANLDANRTTALKDDWLRRPLGELLPPVPLAKLDGYLRAQGLTTLAEHYLFTPDFDQLIASYAQAVLAQTAKRPLDSLLGSANLAPEAGQKIQAAALAALDANRDRIATALCRLSQELLSDDRKLAVCLSGSLGNAARTILSRKSADYTVAVVETARRKTVHSLYLELGLPERDYGPLADFVRKELATNLDLLLRGQISHIVQDGMASLDTATFQKKVEEFMGKELQPISLFGGLLGGVAGLGFAAGQAALGIQPSFAALAGSAAMYGVVGYLTNVIAVWMIFNPHEPVRIGGRTLWLTPGAIAKNQAAFAANMGSFVGNELLSAEKIRHSWDETAPAVQIALAAHMSANSYGLLSALANRTRPALVEWASNRAITLLARAPALVRLALPGLAQVNFAAFTTLWPVEQETALAAALAEKAETAAYETVLRLKHSPATVATVLGPRRTTRAAAAAGCYGAEALLQILNKTVEDQAAWRKLVAGLAQALDPLLDRPGRDLLPPVTRQNLYALLWQQLIDRLENTGQLAFYMEKLAAAITAEFQADRRLGDILGGQLVHLLTTQLDTLVDHLAGQMEQYARAKQTEWANDAYDSLGFFESLLVNRALVRDIVANFIQFELPRFLAAQKTQLRQIGRQFITTSLADRPIGAIGLTLSPVRLTELLTSLAADPGNREAVRLSLGQVLEWLGGLPLRRITNAIGVTGLPDLADRFAEEAEALRLALSAGQTGLAAVQPAIAKILADVIYTLAERRTVATLLQPLAEPLLRETVSHFAHELTQTKAWQDHSHEVLAGFVQRLQNATLYDVFARDRLAADLGDAAAALGDDEVFLRQLQTLVQQIVHDLSVYPDPLVDTAAKQQLIELLAAVICLATPRHLAALLASTDLKGMAEREISRMDAAQIEAMFDRFAGKYFDKLEKYGFIGAIGVIFDLLQLLLRNVK